MQIREIAGFTVLSYPMASPITSVRAFVNAGSAMEVRPGTAHFLEHMFFKGSQRRSYEEMNRLLAAIGESNAYTSQDATAFQIDTTGPNAARAFDLLCEMLFEPALDPEELDKERGVILEEWRSRQDDPGGFFYGRTTPMLFGEDLGHPIVGTDETIRAMTVDDLQAFRARHYDRANIVFALAGALAGLTDAALAAVLDRYVIDRGTENHLPTVIMPVVASPWTAPRREDFRHVSSQAWALLWMPGAPFVQAINAGYAPRVMNDLLGGGMHSLLFTRVREQLGLAYATGSFNYSIGQNAASGAYALCNTDQVPRCLDAMRATIEDLAMGRFEEDLAAAALDHYLFGMAQRAQTPAGVAGYYLAHWFELKNSIDFAGYGYDFHRSRVESLRTELHERLTRAASRLCDGAFITVMNGPDAP